MHEIEYDDYTIEPNFIYFKPKSKIHFLRREVISAGFTIACVPSLLETNSIHRFIVPFSYEAFVLNLSDQEFNQIISITDILQHF